MDKIFIFSLTIINFLLLNINISAAGDIKFLRTNGQKIVNENNEEVFLYGFNTGSWLGVEPWMVKLIQEGVESGKDIFDILEKRFGKEREIQLYKTYVENWLNENDIKYLSETGINFIRVPFWWRAVFDKKYAVRDFYYLDRIISWCKKYNIYVLIDLHGAPGGQSSDKMILGERFENKLWYEKKYMKQTIKIWEKIADRYKNEKIVGGYDILNEAVGAPSMKKLLDVYNILYQKIRKIDNKHIIFMEDGLKGYHRMPDPKLYGWENIVYSFHVYPGHFQKETIEHGIKASTFYFPNMKRAQQYYNVPFHIGEFNSFTINNGGLDYLNRYINIFKTYGWSWSIWSYKKIEDNWNYHWGLTGYIDDWQDIDLKNVTYYEIKNLFESFNIQKVKKNPYFESIIKQYTRDIKNYRRKSFLTNDKMILSVDNGNLWRSPKGSIRVEWGMHPHNFGNWKISDAVIWKIDVKRPGFYEVILNYSSDAGKPEMGLFIDSCRYKTVIIKSTGDWGKYKEQNIGVIKLSRGTHLIKLTGEKEDNGIVNLRKIDLNYLETYYKKTLSPDYSEINLNALSLTKLNRTDGICIDWNSATPYIGYWHDKESAEWEFNSETAGEYDVYLTFATKHPGSSFKIDLNGTSQIVDLPNTGDWQKFQVVDAGNFNIQKGTNNLVITAITRISEGLGNLSEIRLIK